ncbi:BTAD domain-containing putative transcriptional regulator [Desulfoluna spongiiphila]|uniref:ATP-, maltotriose-and DNA-dependent transcriptional regulator MalT n=1 Tax=Desulfoluna spongiiphila TaxID=419481 RepID=A0A1G5CRR1_9BACT|nr:BTAD domain-containing putative transcriptional regulator [Desulfoluna spongiiphila]SCY05072.1 ATP-, maltotriose-and DNA-dependent transcriptional regulator MalT [Desulfoluna spongiiphila]
MADILHSKLLPPHQQGLLDRGRLHACFGDLSRTKITTVVAGAGYGKSTLVARALRQLGARSLWYRLDAFDQDFSVFMGYLISAFEALDPGLPGTFPALPERASVSRQEREAFLLVFVKRLEAIVTSETVVVLDDYHLVRESAEINESLDFLLERLPRLLHFILISRTAPLVRLSRLRVMGETREIGEQELAFTKEEIGALFSKVFGISISRDALGDLHEKSGGWAASLMLFRCSLQGTGDRGVENRLCELKGSRGYVFSYLEENVFETLSPHEQDFLLRSSLLPTLEFGLCDSVLGMDDSLERLRDLEERHLLTFSLDADRRSFQYHHLLRDFLREKLTERVPREEIRALHLAVGAAMEKDNALEALNHYLDGQWYDDARRLVEGLEARFIIQGKVRSLRACLDAFPAAYRNRTPQLLTIEAKLRSCAGMPREAIDLLTRALTLFRGARDEASEMKCLSNLGFLYYYTGNVREARLLLEQIVGGQARGSDTYALTMTFLIFFAAVLGDMEASDAYTQEAMEAVSLLTGADREAKLTLVETSLAYRLYYAGDFAASMDVCRRSLERARQHGLDFCLPLTYYQLSVNCFFLGEFDAGCVYAEQGIKASEAIDLKDSQKGWVYVAWAQNCFGLGDLDRAEAFARKGLVIFECPGNRWGMACTHDLFHDISLARGDAAAARVCLDTATGLIHGYGLTVTEGILGISRAGLALRDGDPEKALGLLKESRDKVRPAAHHLLANYLLEVRCHLMASRHEEAQAVFEQALCLAENTGLAHRVAGEPDQLVPLLARCHGTGHHLFLVERILKAMGTPAMDCLGALAKSGKPLAKRGAEVLLSRMPPLAVPPLTLTLLGPFTATVGDRDIPPEAWTSSKALTIFLYLAAKRRTGFVHRETLIELLWPEENAEKTAKRFNVAMSALRATLEPHRTAKGASSYLVRQQDAYRLDLGDGGRIDVEVFADNLDALGKEEDAPLEHLLAAEACWKGPFLEEYPFDAWCQPEREGLTARYLALLTRIMAHSDMAEDPAKALAYAETYLSLDPHAEPVYRSVMRLHARMGNNAGVVTTYTACRTHMEALGCPLHEKTTALYEQLIG